MHQPGRGYTRAVPPPNLFTALAGATPFVPETLARAAGIALKGLAVPRADEARRLAPPGQGFVLVVLEGEMELTEEGRPAARLEAGDAWFQPGDRGAAMRGGGEAGAVCLLVSTPTPAREPRRVALRGQLAGRWLPLPLLVHRNESVVIEARWLRGRLPLRGRAALQAGRAPRYHVVLEGSVEARLDGGSPVRLGRGDVLEVPAGVAVRLHAGGGDALLLSVEARKAADAGGSPRAGSRTGFDPWSG